MVGEVKNWVKGFSKKELGNSSLNIAYINGGGSEGNIIAEKCEYIVEIRVANEKLNANLVKKFITENSKNLGLKVTEVKIRHDLGSWVTPVEKLKGIVLFAPKKKIKGAKERGYIDIQMLWQTFSKVPTFSLGAGESGQSHKADEYVKISKVLKAQKFYQSILTTK